MNIAKITNILRMKKRFFIAAIPLALIIALALAMSFTGVNKAIGQDDSQQIATKAATETDVTDFMPIALTIEAELKEIHRLYEAGDAKAAKSKITTVYFSIFEGKGFETAISKQIGQDQSFRVETMFGNIRKQISKGIDPLELNLLVNELILKLKEHAGNLKGSKKADTPFALFINALLIIVREGFEAILVISALTTYLVKSGNGDKRRYIYNGTGIAIIASIITAIIIQKFIILTGQQQEAMEGVVMLFATAVLFYVSYWLISKSEIGRWQHYIKSQIDKSLTKGSMFTLGMAAFLAVYREGAETILFYQALAATASGTSITPVISGFVVGLLLLIVIFYVIKYTAVVVPLGPFFAVTSTLLYYLAFTFAGKGIRELQEADWVSETVINGIPSVPFLGFYPTLESMALQSLLILALFIALFYSFLYKPYKEQQVAMGNVMHIVTHIREIHDIIEDVTSHTANFRKVATAGQASEESAEMAEHLDDLDKMIHEVDGHLTDLEKSMEDTFSNLEKEVKGKS